MKCKKFLDDQNIDSKAFTTKHLTNKLQETFQDDICFTDLGKGNHVVVTMSRSTSTILHGFYAETINADENHQSSKVIKTAAQLILKETKSMPSERNYYPNFDVCDSDNAQINVLPPFLKMLLKTLIVTKDSDLKVASLGQAILQAARPRTILAPLQVGLGVQIHHSTGKRFLVDTLNRLGFCIYYREVQGTCSCTNC